MLIHATVSLVHALLHICSVQPVNPMTTTNQGARALSSTRRMHALLASGYLYTTAWYLLYVILAASRKRVTDITTREMETRLCSCTHREKDLRSWYLWVGQVYEQIHQDRTLMRCGGSDRQLLGFWCFRNGLEFSYMKLCRSGKVGELFWHWLARVLVCSVNDRALLISLVFMISGSLPIFRCAYVGLERIRVLYRLILLDRLQICVQNDSANKQARSRKYSTWRSLDLPGLEL